MAAAAILEKFQMAPVDDFCYLGDMIIISYGRSKTYRRGMERFLETGNSLALAVSQPVNVNSEWQSCIVSNAQRGWVVVTKCTDEPTHQVLCDKRIYTALWQSLNDKTKVHNRPTTVSHQSPAVSSYTQWPIWISRDKNRCSGHLYSLVTDHHRVVKRSLLTPSDGCKNAVQSQTAVTRSRLCIQAGKRVAFACVAAPQQYRSRRLRHAALC